MARDEHQFELESSGHVVNGGEARIGGGTLEVGDLALPQAKLPGELGLTQPTAEACSSQDPSQVSGITNK